MAVRSPRILVVGYNALDVTVTLIEPRDTFLDFIDRYTVAEFTHQVRDNGMSLRLGSAIEKVDETGWRRKFESRLPH